MPFDTTPRIFDLRSLRPFGSFTPGFASGLFMPFTTFGAPQTTSMSSPPPSVNLADAQPVSIRVLAALDNLGNNDVIETGAFVLDAVDFMAEHRQLMAKGLGIEVGINPLA